MYYSRGFRALMNHRITHRHTLKTLCAYTVCIDNVMDWLSPISPVIEFTIWYTGIHCSLVMKNAIHTVYILYMLLVSYQMYIDLCVQITPLNATVLHGKLCRVYHSSSAVLDWQSKAKAIVSFSQLSP